MQEKPSRPVSPHDARSRRGRSAATAMASALLCAVAGCFIAPGDPGDPGDPAEPDEPRQVRTSFAIQVNADGDEYGVFLRLDESATTRGQFAGTMAVNGVYLQAFRAVEITPVTATMVGDELRVASGSLEQSMTLSFSWDVLALRLEDEDRDGVLESGSGRIEGQVFQPSGFQDTFTAAPDGYPVTARAYRGLSQASDVLPWEQIVVDFGQPVSIDESERYRVLADGEPVAGTFQLEGERDGLHTSFVFRPDDFWPLGATIEVDLDGVKNFVDAPVVVAQGDLQVMADPGALSTNLGFEQALAGWYAVGDTSVIAGSGDVAPVEGAGMAALRTTPDAGNPVHRSGLTGYIDVPADATVLDLSLALLASADELPGSITVSLRRAVPGDGLEIAGGYAFDHASAVFEPCACGVVDGTPLTRRAGPFRQEMDVTALRGERLFVDIEVYGGAWSGPAALALAPLVPPLPPVPSIVLVDDLQIR